MPWEAERQAAPAPLLTSAGAERRQGPWGSFEAGPFPWGETSAGSGGGGQAHTAQLLLLPGSCCWKQPCRPCPEALSGGCPQVGVGLAPHAVSHVGFLPGTQTGWGAEYIPGDLPARGGGGLPPSGPAGG